MSENATYIVAVSGGLDSVCLLHALVNHDPLINIELPLSSNFIVAHVNHGIRGEESDRDEEFVSELAKGYGLQFESTRLNLDPNASEESAREKRYIFLDSVVKKYHAKGILLAHHQGDILETAIINMIRGTGRRGISSLKSTPDRIRPLLGHTKLHLKEYAKINGLKWTEDSTNNNPKYLRNRIRLALEGISLEKNERALSIINQFSLKNELIDKEIANILQYKIRKNAIISRNWFVKLPHIVAAELVYALLNRLNIQNVDRELVDKLVVAIKVGKPGKKLDIDKNTLALITKRSLRIIDRSTLKARTL